MDVIGLGSVVKFAVNIDGLPSGSHLSDTEVDINATFFIKDHWEDTQLKISKGDSDVVIENDDNVAIYYVNTDDVVGESGVTEGTIKVVIEVEYKDPDTSHMIKDISVLSTEVAVTSPK